MVLDLKTFINVFGLCAARLIKKNEQFKALLRVAQNPCYKHTTKEMETTIEERKNIYLKALKKWGEKAQMEMAQEEATELAMAIRKQYRKNTDETFLNLIDEIADVEIMIEQIELMHNHLGIRNLIEIQKDIKLTRLERRLKNNQFED